MLSIALDLLRHDWFGKSADSRANNTSAHNFEHVPAMANFFASASLVGLLAPLFCVTYVWTEPTDSVRCGGKSMQAVGLAESPYVSQVDDDVEFSVVMPCLNESRTVATCIDKALDAFARIGVRGEVIVADNGSSDGSVEIAEKHGARVVHVKRKGYGSALQGGIDSALGRYVIMGDADDSYDFSQLEPFVERLRSGDELVMGNRFRGGIKPGAMPWLHRYVGNPVLSGILNLFYRSPISDAHCGLRGFRKDSYEKLGLSTPGMEFASEMIVKACLNKQRMSEVPIVLHPDGRDRPPHLRSFRDGWRHLRFLLLLCPTWLYLMPAVAMLTLGVVLLAWLTPGPQVAFGAFFDLPALMLGSATTIVGYQLLWLWAFARLFGWTNGLLPFDKCNEFLYDRCRLEPGILCGLVILLGGLAFCAWFAFQDSAPRYCIFGLTTIVLGTQTIFGSFLLSMLKMSETARLAWERTGR